MKEQAIMERFKIIIYFIVLLWVIEAANFFTGHRLSMWGIWPRTLEGLIGIPLSPFLHGSIRHLFLNSGPLAVLGGLILLQSRAAFFKTSLWVILAGGAGLWLIGRPAIHVGASTLVLGYFGYLITRGVVQKRLGALAISLVTLFAYGGLVWSLLPSGPHISWEGHVCGFAAGILAARLEPQSDAKQRKVTIQR